MQKYKEPFTLDKLRLDVSPSTALAFVHLCSIIIVFSDDLFCYFLFHRFSEELIKMVSSSFGFISLYADVDSQKHFYLTFEYLLEYFMSTFVSILS